MASRIDAVVDGCYCKGLLKSRVIWKQLTSYVVLVVLAVRDSYLIDCCSFTENVEKLTQIVSSIVASVKRVLPGIKDCVELVILAINDRNDFILVRKDSLDAKIARVMENKWDMHPLVVDVGGAAPAVIGEEKVAAIGRCLANMNINTSETSFGGRKQLVSYLEVGARDELDFVFLAGWLLGYPCIYYCGSGSDETTSMLNGNALSGRSLCKFSLEVQLCGGGYIDVMAFTAPCDLLSSGALHASIRELLRERVEKINLAIAAVSGLMVPGSALVQEELFQMTNVSL